MPVAMDYNNGMSTNRENVIWQSKDGTWNRGFYSFVYVNEDSEDFDYEWDVEYGEDFEWVSIGHATAERADASWTGSNPGGHTEIPYKGNSKECKRLDDLARDAIARRRARQISVR